MLSSPPMIFLLDKVPLPSGAIIGLKTRYRVDTFTPFVFQIYRPMSADPFVAVYRLVHETNVDSFPAPDVTGVATVCLFLSKAGQGPGYVVIGSSTCLSILPFVCISVLSTCNTLNSDDGSVTDLRLYAPRTIVFMSLISHPSRN